MQQQNIFTQLNLNFKAKSGKPWPSDGFVEKNSDDRLWWNAGKKDAESPRAERKGGFSE